MKKFILTTVAATAMMAGAASATDYSSITFNSFGSPNTISTTTAPATYADSNNADRCRVTFGSGGASYSGFGTCSELTWGDFAGEYWITDFQGAPLTEAIAPAEVTPSYSGIARASNGNTIVSFDNNATYEFNDNVYHNNGASHVANLILTRVMGSGYPQSDFDALVIVLDDFFSDAEEAGVVTATDISFDGRGLLAAQFTRSDTDQSYSVTAGSTRQTFERIIANPEYDYADIAEFYTEVITIDLRELDRDDWSNGESLEFNDAQINEAFLAFLVEEFGPEGAEEETPAMEEDREEAPVVVLPIVTGSWSAWALVDASSKAKYVQEERTRDITRGETVVRTDRETRMVLNQGWLAAANKLENKLANDIKNGQKLVGQFEHFVLVINTASSGVEIKKEFVVAKSGVDKLTITPRLGLGLGGDANYRSYGAEVAYETTEIRDLLLKLGYDTGTHFDFTQGSIDGCKSRRGNGNTGDYGYVYIEQGAADEIKVTVKADTQDDYSIGLKKGPYSASVNQDGQVSAKYTVKF